MQRHATPMQLRAELERRGLNPEVEVQDAILKWLKLQGVFAWRQETTGVPKTNKAGRTFLVRSHRAGTPDILGFLPWGQGLAIEVKRPGLRGRKRAGVRVEQAAWLNEAQCRSLAFVMVADTLADVERKLEAKLCSWKLGRRSA